MTTQEFDKILIVDDEPDIGEALQLFLSDSGFSTSLASDGVLALDMLINEKDYAVVLLDISMPGLNGVTVLKQLKEADCNTAVIMMSGHGNENIAVECMRNGAEDYISKPFALEDLLLRIERASAHRRERIEKQQLQKEKEDFILMLSHDIKNPLTAVIGSIDIVREARLGPINTEQKEYLESAIDSCNEAVTMIDNLLDIRKFEAGKIKMAINTYSAHELIKKVANQFARPAKYDDIELSVSLGSGDPEISVDKSAFNRVLGNLLGNSLKFTPEGGKITISCRCVAGNDLASQNVPSYVPVPAELLNAGSFIRLAVCDTGNGIPHDELESIFDRYTQLTRRSDRESGGAGLGLAYCKLAINSFHGIIWAESKNELGSEFVILLPSTSSGSD